MDFCGVELIVGENWWWAWVKKSFKMHKLFNIYHVRIKLSSDGESGFYINTILNFYHVLFIYPSIHQNKLDEESSLFRQALDDEREKYLK